MIDEQTYEAFFDELGEIEKRRMLTKVAILAGAKSLLNVGKVMAKNPGQAAKTLGNVWKGGVAAAPQGAGTLSKGLHGAKALWGTPAGKVAILGAGGATAGLVGTGAVAGRATAPRQQY